MPTSNLLPCSRETCQVSEARGFGSRSGVGLSSSYVEHHLPVGRRAFVRWGAPDSAGMSTMSVNVLPRKRELGPIKRQNRELERYSSKPEMFLFLSEKQRDIKPRDIIPLRGLLWMQSIEKKLHGCSMQISLPRFW